MAYDEKTAERVRKVLSGRREVVEKKLMGGLCFSREGYRTDAALKKWVERGVDAVASRRSPMVWGATTGLRL
jgi:hypothetical protein